MNEFFTETLLRWNDEQNDRKMPWKGEKDPYRIWLSEVILQQTRVEQGWPYYERFIRAYPTVKDLAAAPDESVFKLWEGLGYYSRCKNLLAAARTIVARFDGKFPDTYDEILALPGIGHYTASAIASFAFDLPHAVLDGNVFRVLARVFGLKAPIDSTAGKRLFTQLADELLDRARPGIYNQAIMDFGAVICKPKAPLCPACPQQQHCEAYRHGWVDQLPVKEQVLVRRTRWLYYFVFKYDGRVYIRKRTGKDIWQNLYEFTLIEPELEMEVNDLVQTPAFTSLLKNAPFRIARVSAVFKQQLTHQTVIGRFIEVELDKELTSLQQHELVPFQDLTRVAFPKFIIGYLREKNVNLS